MEDLEIIGLYFKRDETAIDETAAKYGAFCHSIALNILAIDADAEECVNDTYLRTWNSIPPQKPDKLGSWLGRVVRNIAYDLWKKNHRQKRYAGMEQLLNELEDCIPSPATVECEIEEVVSFIAGTLPLHSGTGRFCCLRQSGLPQKLYAGPQPILGGTRLHPAGRL